MSQGLSLPGLDSIVLGWESNLGLSLYCTFRVLFGQKKAAMASRLGGGGRGNNYRSDDPAR